MNRRAAFLFLVLAFAWGIPYLLIKVSVQELSPAVLVLVRTALAATLLLPFAFARGAVRPVLRHWRALVAYTVVEIAIPWVLLNSAETRLPSSTTGLLISTVPLAAVAIAFLTGRGERMGTSGWLGLLCGFVGVAALVGLDIDVSDRVAVLQMLVVVIGYALGPLMLSRYLSDVPGLGVVALSLTLAAVAYVPVVLLGPGLPDAMPSTRVIASVIVLAVVCTAGAFLALFALIGLVGPVRSTAFTYLCPAVAILAGVAFLDEAFTVWTAAGFALVLLGCYLLTRRPGGAARSRRGREQSTAGRSLTSVDEWLRRAEFLDAFARDAHTKLATIIAGRQL